MATRKSIRVGTARSKPGQWTKGTLAVGHYPDSPITTPVNILSGAVWLGASCEGGLSGITSCSFRAFE